MVYIKTLLKLYLSPPNKPKSPFVFPTNTESMSQETVISETKSLNSDYTNGLT